MTPEFSKHIFDVNKHSELYTYYYVYNFVLYGRVFLIVNHEIYLTIHFK